MIALGLSNDFSPFQLFSRCQKKSTTSNTNASGVMRGLRKSFQTHFTLNPMLSFSLMYSLRYILLLRFSLSLVEPPALIHQFYFVLSFVHKYSKSLSLAKQAVCVEVWYPTTYFFFFVFHTLWLRSLCFFPYSQCFHYNIFQFIL